MIASLEAAGAFTGAIIQSGSKLLLSHREIEADISARLDSLRGLSAIAVLLGHCGQIFVAPLHPFSLTYFGLLAQTAVMLFFVLSGLLITKSITRNASRYGGFQLTIFARARLARIYPPFLVSMLLILAIWITTPQLLSADENQLTIDTDTILNRILIVERDAWLGTLFFLNGFLVKTVSANTSLWSLSYEVWYYVIAGLIAWKPRSGAMIALSLALCLGLLNKLFVLYGVVWFSGAAVALLHDHAVCSARLSKIAAAAGGTAAMLATTHYVGGTFAAESFQGLPIAPLAAVNLSSGLACAAFVHLFLTKRFRFVSIARGTASFSYTLYVTHFPILLLIYGAVSTRAAGHVLHDVSIAASAFLLTLIFARIVGPHIENATLLARLRSS